MLQINELDLVECAKEGNLERVKYLVKQGADINIQNNCGSTALMWASINRHIEIVKYLVESGADINIKDNNGDTALMQASMDGHLEVAKYLVKQGADINIQNKDGDTALMWASICGRLEIVKHLIEQGADINIQNNWGYTALMWASRNGELEIVKYLKEAINKQNQKVETACKCDNREDSIVENSWELKVKRVENGYMVSYLAEVGDNRYVERVHACEDGADKDFYITWDGLDVDVRDIDDKEVALANVFNMIRNYFGVYYNKHKRVNLSIGFEDASQDSDE